MKKHIIYLLLAFITFQLSAQNDKHKALFTYKLVQNLNFPDGTIEDKYVIGVPGRNVLLNS